MSLEFLFVGRLADAKSAGQRDSHPDLVHPVSPARGVVAPTIVAREGEIETVGCAVVVAVEFGERKGQEVKGSMSMKQEPRGLGGMCEGIYVYRRMGVLAPTNIKNSITALFAPCHDP